MNLDSPYAANHYLYPFSDKLFLLRVYINNTITGERTRPYKITRYQNPEQAWVRINRAIEIKAQEIKQQRDAEEKQEKFLKRVLHVVNIQSKKIFQNEEFNVDDSEYIIDIDDVEIEGNGIINIDS